MLSGFLRFNVIKPESINKIHRYLQNKQLWKRIFLSF
jgi:hypothetical protein